MYPSNPAQSCECGAGLADYRAALSRAAVVTDLVGVVHKISALTSTLLVKKRSRFRVVIDECVTCADVEPCATPC